MQAAEDRRRATQSESSSPARSGTTRQSGCAAFSLLACGFCDALGRIRTHNPLVRSPGVTLSRRVGSCRVVPSTAGNPPARQPLCHPVPRHVARVPVRIPVLRAHRATAPEMCGSRQRGRRGRTTDWRWQSRPAQDRLDHAVSAAAGRAALRRATTRRELIRRHQDQLLACDCYVVATRRLKTLYVRPRARGPQECVGVRLRC